MTNTIYIPSFVWVWGLTGLVKETFFCSNMFWEKKAIEKRNETIWKRKSDRITFIRNFLFIIYRIYVCIINHFQIIITHTQWRKTSSLFISLLIQNDNRLSFRISNPASIVWKAKKRIVSRWWRLVFIHLVSFALNLLGG